ncbi:Hypothetical predicted protein [Paramuricea clavata]|uniref:Uncharacterized protein n=1 Tax=Paramuricea clavata TaxID=317549 RepID=A0A6S7JMK0_PARCT|nr:Hypothetical predicted protein [Paramuricea clavata]
MEVVHENQVKEILPYQFEPEMELISHSSDSEEDSSSSDESIDEVFELANSWWKSTLSWCKCGHCKIMPETLENFCCKERAVEYDEYDEKLSQAESSGDACLTQLPDFQQNMLTESVLKIDACRYVEENWPPRDDEMAKTHKIFRHLFSLQEQLQEHKLPLPLQTHLFVAHFPVQVQQTPSTGIAGLEYLLWRLAITSALLGLGFPSK